MHQNRTLSSHATPRASSSDTFTIAATITAIGTWTDLPDTRRRDLASALTTVARLAGCPHNAWLNVIQLREQVLDQPGARFDLTEARMRNLRALIGYVLDRLGLIEPVEPDGPLPAVWAELMPFLTTQEASGMRRFACFCANRCLEPQAVSASTLLDFQTWLETRTLNKLPRKRVGRLRTCWNQLRCRVPERSLPPIAAPGVTGQSPFALPLEAFPPAFQADLEAFQRRLSAAPFDSLFSPAPGDSLDDDDDAPSSLPRPLRPSTVALRSAHCRWAASALVASGTPVANITSIAGLVTPLERPRKILQFLHERAGGKPSATGMHVAEILLMIAKHHARLPDREVARIRDWGKLVRLDYRGITKKNALTVDRMMAPDRMARYLVLANTLMRKARTLRTSSPARACSLALRAAVIELLSKIPLRLANLLALRLDSHLHRSDSRQGLMTGITLQAAETKNHQDIAFPVSRETGLILREWINDFRPIVAPPGNRFLFPGHGTGDRPMTPQALRDAVKDTMQRHVGVVLSPHQFRHLAANLYLDQFPDGYETVRQLLGHADLKTTLRAYAKIRRDQAVKRFDEVILSARPTGKGRR